MFRSARLKLTAWYLLIIMLISSVFSLVIYTNINEEYDRFEHLQKTRVEREQRLRAYEEYQQAREQAGFPVPSLPPASSLPDLSAVDQARTRLQLTLLLINLGILGVAGLAGYFLAGRTLKPISQMLDEQDRFITDSSHELRTPLTALRSEIEVNLRDKNLTLKEAKNLLQSNLEEVVNLQALSDGLLKLAQYQKGKPKVTFPNISLAAVAGEACRKVAPLAAVKKIQIKNQTKDYKIEGDKSGLIELLVIFLDNSIKYSPAKTMITLKSKKTNHWIEIEVTDQGMGIDQKDLPHLFDRFFRADQSRTKTNIQGYGLGLSIAQKIIETHQGQISVNSRVGKGTTITLVFPLKQNRQLI